MNKDKSLIFQVRVKENTNSRHIQDQRSNGWHLYLINSSYIDKESDFFSEIRNQIAVYFFLSQKEEKHFVYVGQTTANIEVRFNAHKKDKRDKKYEQLLFLIPEDQQKMQSELKHYELLFIKELKKNKKNILESKQMPDKRREPKKTNKEIWDENYAYLKKLISPFLPFKLFETSNINEFEHARLKQNYKSKQNSETKSIVWNESHLPNKQEIFYFQDRNEKYYATAEHNFETNKTTVLKNSWFKKQQLDYPTHPRYQIIWKKNKKIMNSLISRKILKERERDYFFIEQWQFNTPSQATEFFA